MQNWRHFSIHHTHRAVNRDLASCFWALKSMSWIYGSPYVPVKSPQVGGFSLRSEFNHVFPEFTAGGLGAPALSIPGFLKLQVSCRFHLIQ